MRTDYVAESKVYLCCTNVTFAELEKIKDYVAALPYIVDVSAEYECDYFHKEGEVVGTVVKDTYIVWLSIPNQVLIRANCGYAIENLRNCYERIVGLDKNLYEHMNNES